MSFDNSKNRIPLINKRIKQEDFKTTIPQDVLLKCAEMSHIVYDWHEDFEINREF